MSESAGIWEHHRMAEQARDLILTGNTREDVIIVPRMHPPAMEPVAFLASFTHYVPRGDDPESLVFPLWPGINRVGRKPPLTNYQPVQLPRSLVESRQWLVIIDGHRALAIDDRTTNQSTYFGPDFQLPDDREIRRDGLGFRPGSRLLLDSGGQRLDWYGTEVAHLEPGGILCTCYAAFVFGWLS